MKTIPNEVILAAKELIADYGVSLAHIGRFSGREVYQFKFPEHEKTGFPFLYLQDTDGSGRVTEITGEAALDIIVSLGVE